MSAKTKTGYDAWREQNLRLPFPSEFRTMPDGGIKVIWEDVIRDWWELEYGYFTWTPRSGRTCTPPCSGTGSEERGER